jgi:hypothetical protein
MNPLQAAEVYDSNSGGWSQIATLWNARTEHTATLLPGGTILVVGGRNNGGRLASAEIYDPATAAWDPVASLAAKRAGHTATLLLDGRVLVVGGYDGATSLAGAELFDLTSNGANAASPLVPSAAINAAGQLVLSGSGLGGVSGGSGGNGPQDSPANHPLVQLYRLENGHTTFVLPDPAAPISETSFTSVPVALFSGYAVVTVFVNGQQSKGVPVYFPIPNIGVFANGAGVSDGGAVDFGTMTRPATMQFSINNPGTADLSGIGIAFDGPDAASFSLLSNPASLVNSGASTSFTLQLPPASTTRTWSAVLRITNNVPAKNPYDIQLHGLTLSFSDDTDGDGLNDASEFHMAPLGFNWEFGQTNLVGLYYASANGAGLYSTSQMPVLNVSGPTLRRNDATGKFTLTVGVQKSPAPDQPFSLFPMNGPGASASINSSGELEFEFLPPEDTAFFRLQAR